MAAVGRLARRVDSAADGGTPDGRQDPEEATQEEAAEEAEGLAPFRTHQPGSMAALRACCVVPRLWVSGAGDGDRTRDMQLGRLPLCQLSYSRTSPPPVVRSYLTALGRPIRHHSPIQIPDPSTVKARKTPSAEIAYRTRLAHNVGAGGRAPILSTRRGGHVFPVAPHDSGNA